jgi:hypothetical protein
LRLDPAILREDAPRAKNLVPVRAHQRVMTTFCCV